MIGRWVAKLYDKDDAFVAELPMEGLTIELVLNNIWTAEARINYLKFEDLMQKQGTTAIAALTGGFRYVDIQRNGVTQFRGILSQPSGDRQGDNRILTLPFKSWLTYFTRRYITKIYTGTDAGDIAWDMIDTMQAVTNGDIGITEGTIEATVSRDRTYQLDEVAKNIIGLSADNIINGFDFEITHDKALTVKERIGTDRPNIIFDASNIRNDNFAFQVGLNLTNRVYVLGEGFGSDQASVTRDASSTYQEKWFLLEEVQTFPTVKETDTLEDHGDKILALDQDTRLYPLKIQVDTSVIDPTSYGVGDKVFVSIADVINDLYRIRKKTYHVTRDDEYVDLEFY